ncbi:MAG: aldehyde ferredoxin oxidoreductase family protein [Candidatus Lokiarchaeota archaeon]|nr:aldehyde ferredoxin oxidoreductase family protein [Candidatus Lokiarchaeota archaeon]
MSENLIGYNGKIVYVNLTDEKVDVKELDPQIAKDYLGGTGLSAKITYDLLSETDYGTLKNDPYAEINPLIFATGPVTGTNRPSSGRYSVTAISPLTGIWGEGTSGGYFPISLRNSGFDAIVITGKSKNPTYLYIHDETIEFKDANTIWGKDTYESQSILKSELNNDKARIATIGIAGENLVKYAGIINDEGRAIGRSGMGAIMGSKNLKALAVHGTNRVQIADNAIGKEMLKQEEDVKRKDLLKTLVPFLFTLYGTNCYLDMGMALGDTPGYYFTRNEFFADKLTGKTLREEYPVLDYGCAGCTMRCGKTTIVENDGKEIKVDGPEYESVAAFGPLCGVFDSKKVILSNHMCNVYGFDTISSGVSIAFLIYLVENNLGIENIKQHLNDISIGEIKWGNGDVVLKLLDKIAIREGIGKILADGVKAMAKEFNVDPELAAHVKGLEIPMHDPRAFSGQALSYMTCYMGANHEKCDWFGAELMLLKYPKIRVKPGDRTTIKGREKGVANLQDLRAIDDSAANCNFINPPLEHIIKYINASTNFDYNRKSLMLVGERINALKRLISCKLGTTKEDDKLPQHVLAEMKSGKTEGIKLDMEGSLENYYKIRGWDWETGWPTKEKLKELNIQ